MIDLRTTKAIVEEVMVRMEPLQGVELTDHPEDDSQTKSVNKTTERRRKAEITRELQWCADSLNLAANLIRNELWVYKGEDDAIQLANDTE